MKTKSSSTWKFFVHFLALGLLLLSTAQLLAQRPEDAALPPPPPVHAEFKFDFSGKARDGYTNVSADTIYTSERAMVSILVRSQSPWSAAEMIH